MHIIMRWDKFAKEKDCCEKRIYDIIYKDMNQRREVETWIKLELVS